MKRCSWAQGQDELIRQYHDSEYGRPKKTDAELFEKLSLEIFQAGLSWRTVLYKRPVLREWFLGFEPHKTAAITKERIEEMMSDPRGIRNLRKAQAVVHNANMHIVHFSGQGSFKQFVYSHSDAGELCQGLKDKGYKFIGVTICESFMMSVGAAQGHEKNCFLYKGED